MAVPVYKFMTCAFESSVCPPQFSLYAEADPIVQVKMKSLSEKQAREMADRREHCRRRDCNAGLRGSGCHCWIQMS